MAHIHVILRDEQGTVLQELGDDGVELFRALPSRDDPEFPYLRFIDPYDTTVFTRQQMSAVVPELRRLAAAKPGAVLRRVLEMAEACESTLHSRLVFIGD